MLVCSIAGVSQIRVYPTENCEKLCEVTAYDIDYTSDVIWIWTPPCKVEVILDELNKSAFNCHLYYECKVAHKQNETIKEQKDMKFHLHH